MNSVIARIAALLACFLLTSQLLSKDSDAAFDYGATDQTPEHFYRKGLAYFYGVEGETQNRGLAISFFKKAAAADFAPAHTALGVAYQQGNVFFNSPRKALRSFEAAAALGDIFGQFNAANSYFSGSGTLVNYTEAKNRLLQVVDPAKNWQISPEAFGTARQTRAHAYLLLGFIFGNKKDRDNYDAARATEMFHKADALNIAQATLILAIRYARGDGTEQDHEQSRALLERYQVTALNEMANAVQNAYFEGMDREDIRANIDKAVGSYEKEVAERIVAMRIGLGVSLLDEKKLLDPEQAFVWLEPVATEDQPLACSRLARLYYRGEGTEQNLERARELLEIAHRRVPHARYNLAVMLQRGEGGPADPERAASLFARAANDYWYPAIHYKDDLAAAPFISEYEARELLLEESRVSYIPALFCHGRRLLFGIGFDQDILRGSKLIRRAADSGHPQARYFYGVYFAKDQTFWGMGASEEDKAIADAAAAGLPAAVHHLGLNALKKDDYATARQHFEAAAKDEHPRAFHSLGMLYWKGQGVTQDYAKALELFRKGEALDDPLCIRQIGVAHERGNGLPADAQQAFEQYKEARKLGSTYANHDLGLLYTNGKLGEPNWDEAVPYFEQSANFRNAEAFLILGDCYRLGRGVTKNFETARRYYTSVGFLDSKLLSAANYRSAIIERDPDYTGPKTGTLLGALRMNEIAGYPLAGYQLGIMNMEGINIKQNPKKAYAKFLKFARQLGSDLQRELGDSFHTYYKKSDALPASKTPETYEERFQHEALLDACYRIAQLHLSGELPKSKPAGGIPWLKAAANGGHADAQLAYAAQLKSGELTASNPAEARRLTRLAARSLDTARYTAARSILKGEDPEATEADAHQFLREAALNGHEPSLELLRQHEIPLHPNDTQSPETPVTPPSAPLDDGIDGPIDLDLAARFPLHSCA